METLTSVSQDTVAQMIADSLQVSPATGDVLDEFGFTYLLIFGLVIIWLFGVVYFLRKLLKRYTFGNWETEENPRKNPYLMETFAMPRGVFRGILTLSVLFIVLLLEVANLQMQGLEDKIDKLLSAFELIIAFYFGSKLMHHVTSADKRKVVGPVRRVERVSSAEFHSEEAEG